MSQFIIDNKLSKIEIHGYTDSIGDDTYNVNLSYGRAESVAEYLKQNGCNKVNFIPKGFGKASPISSNETELGRARNRRVEIKIIK